ncbi:Detected protein of unknown function [Hibiscus syriacus]|uniref:C2H2-type domain-containing protein n=1 Tax=Hibiscus syriacus TaxID=106335 RepID=A0A6A3ACN2_HIBSY|nr:Detected protein of unknown function [Hibiscus syriacus]
MQAHHASALGTLNASERISHFKTKLRRSLQIQKIFLVLLLNQKALNSKKMIGKASLQNGLYILPASTKIKISKSFTALKKVDNVMLWEKGIVQISSCVDIPQQNELPPILSLPTDLSYVITPIDPPVVPITTSPIPTLNTLPENTPTPIQNIPQTTPIKQLRFYTRKRKHIPEAVLQSDACRELDLGPAAEIEEEINLPQGKKVVGCKWIFTVKYNSNGSIQRYKARLVAKGFTQTYVIDFTETFAPVAKLNTVRVLLSLAVNYDWKLYQLDVKNVFLNGKLKEEVYMKLPPGLKSVEGSNKQSLADHTLFIKVTSTNKKAILIVYVDDIILIGDDEEEICNLKLLNKEFETKDLGKLRYFLGMEVARSKGLVINQRKYVFDLLKETGFLGCKPIDTPMEASLKFNKEDGSLVDKEKFQRLVGKLIYLSLTRSYIAFPINVISQHMTNPTEEHMAATNRILKYLKKTLGHGLMFKKTQDKTVKIFTDSSWAGDLTERRSTSGYCTFVWGNLTTWRSKKQSVVSSSAEAEFRALALGICEGIWLLKLLKELVTNQEDHFEVLCDNQSVIQIAKNLVQHDRTKHVEIDRHFIADQVNKKTATLSYILSEEQVADILTKALPKPVFNKFLFKLGLYNQLKKNIKRHLRSHESDVASERFKCDFEGCLHTFSTKSNMRQHFKAVHEKLEPFACSFSGCGMRFAFKHVRDNHEKSAQHVYVPGDIIESDEQFRSRPRGGRKRTCPSGNACSKKNYSTANGYNDGSRAYSWLLSSLNR